MFRALTRERILKQWTASGFLSPLLLSFNVRFHEDRSGDVWLGVTHKSTMCDWGSLNQYENHASCKKYTQNRLVNAAGFSHRR